MHSDRESYEDDVDRGGDLAPDDQLVPLGNERRLPTAADRGSPAGPRASAPAPPPLAAPPPALEKEDRPPPQRAIARKTFYRDRVEHGKVVGDGPAARLWGQVQAWLMSPGEREEEMLDALLEGLPPVSRQNVWAVVSPEGGVGKTTMSYVLGAAVADATRMSVVVADAAPDYGPLADLAADEARSNLTLEELLRDFEGRERPPTPELRPYLSSTPSGLRLLGAPTRPEAMRMLRRPSYERLLELLADVELVIVDCAMGVERGLAAWAIERADRLMVVTSAGWIATNQVARAIANLPLERGVLVRNERNPPPPGQSEALDAQFERLVAPRESMPYDRQLSVMLDSGTYELSALQRRTRVAIKQLAVTMGQGLS